MQADEAFVGLPPLAEDSKRLLILATWIGHLQRESRKLEGKVPPAHWRDVLAAFLVSDDPTSRWIQSADRAELIRRDLLIPSASFMKQVLTASRQGPSPPSADGWFTRSIRGAGGLLDTAALLRAGEVAVSPVHILAALVMPPTDAHQEERHRFCNDPETFRLYVAVWLGEFRIILTEKLPIESHLQDFISGIHRFDRLGMRERYPEVVVDFVKRASRMMPREAEQEPAPIAVATATLVEMAIAGVVKDPVVGKFVQRHREALFRQMIGATDPLPATNSTGLGSLALVVRAGILAERTSPRQPIDSRHLLAAILAADETLPPLASLPRGDGSDELRQLRRVFLATVARAADRDLRSVWADAILGETMSRTPIILDTGNKDLLGFTRYARAFATVIADSQLQPPLSIGLFGPWGSGKSFLIDKIKEELKDIEARALADTDSRFCAGLVPVDFNAWHYAETNLWASLFVHILEELGERLNSGRDRGSPMQQRGRVLAQIGRTYAQLRDAEADAAHADAEAVRFRKLQEMTREEGKNSALVTTLLGAVKETLSWNEGSYRPLEDAAAPAYQAAEKRLGELEVEINEFGEIGSNIFTIIRRAIHLPFWQIFWLGLGTATMLVSMLLISYDAFDTTIMRQLASLASGLFVTIGAIVAWLGTYRRWLKQGVDKLRSALSKQEARELRDKASELQRFRDQEIQATARAASERERSLALQSQLTELEAQAKALEPRRRLAEFVAYRAESESYRSLLGIPAMIRNDIDQLTTYLQDITWEEGQIPIKRIILFVDDLDRCAPDVVVRVLEAVHILLASNLFIIIVGVDPRWLQGALAERFRGLLRVRPSVDGGATPLEFLEKIFQVPFWIPDMTQAGKELLIQQSLPAPRIEKLSQAALTHGGTVEISQERDAEQTASTPNLDESTVPPLPTVQPILLEPEERELLVELASVAGDTPRRLKRFARCYLILRASFTSGQLAELRSSRTYEAAARLLAAANGAPMAWPDFRQDLSRAQLQDAVWDVAERFNSDLPHESEILKNAFSTRDGPTALTVADVFPWISEVSRFTFPAASARLDDISVSPRDTGTLERPSPDLKAEIPEQS